MVLKSRVALYLQGCDDSDIQRVNLASVEVHFQDMKASKTNKNGCKTYDEIKDQVA